MRNKIAVDPLAASRTVLPGPLRSFGVLARAGRNNPAAGVRGGLTRARPYRTVIW